jgi:hypothetical protein
VSTATHTEHGNGRVARRDPAHVVGPGVRGIAIADGVPVPADVLNRIAAVQAEIEERLDAGCTPLPADPDLDAVSAWSTTAYQRHWGWA